MGFSPNAILLAGDDLSRIRYDRHCLMAALQEADEILHGRPTQISENACRCPFHHDEHPSGSLHQDWKDRAWLYTCHGCDWNRLNPRNPVRSGDALAVLRMAAQLAGSDLDMAQAAERVLSAAARSIASPAPQLPPDPTERAERAGKARGEALAAHSELIADSNLLDHLWQTRAINAETVGKFSIGHLESGPRRWWSFPINHADESFMALKLHAADDQHPKSQWRPAGAKAGMPLFPVHLQPDTPVFFCPGELKALAVASLGLATVGWTCGESVTRLPEELVRILAGRDVVIPADCDDAGRSWAASAADQLQRASVSCRILDLDLPEPGADIGDWIVAQRITAARSADDVARDLLQRAADAPRTPGTTQNTAADPDQVGLAGDHRPVLRGIGEIWADAETWKPIRRVATHIKELDAVLHGGYTTGGIHLIAGKPGNAKTQLATQIAINAARNGTPTGLISLEMSEPDIARLCLSQLSGVDRRRIDDGISNISDPAVAIDVKQAMARFHRVSLGIVDGEQYEHGCAREDIRAAVAEGVEKHGWKLVVLDHFGELAPSAHDPPGGAALDLDKANASELRRIAREHDVALLVVTPLRKAAQFKDVSKGKFSLDDVMGSAAIGYAVHTAVGVNAQYKINASSYVELKVLKNRKGPHRDSPLQLPWSPRNGRIG